MELGSLIANPFKTFPLRVGVYGVATGPNPEGTHDYIFW